MLSEKSKANLGLILEYEPTEDADFRLEKIFEFLFEDMKETLGDGKNNDHRDNLPASETK